MKRLLLLVISGLLILVAGCIFDDDDDKKKGDAASIEDLSMGGAVFLMEDFGYGIAEIGVFDDDIPFNSAEVYVNNIKLTRKAGIYSNPTTIPIDDLTISENVRIVVHAFGDSVVTEIPIPQKPDIIKPVEGYSASIQNSLEVEINYPGEHQLITMLLSEQDQVAVGFETAEEKLKVIVPDEKLIKTGTSMLSAYSANSSAEIPDDYQLIGQFEVFIVASSALRTIEFTE